MIIKSSHIFRNNNSYNYESNQYSKESSEYQQQLYLVPENYTMQK